MNVYKVYKVRLYKILLDLIYGLVAAFIFMGTTHFWIEGNLIYLGGILVFALDLIFVLSDRFLCIKIHGNKLIVKRLVKMKQVFVIDECCFTAKVKSNYVNTDCKLEVIEKNGCCVVLNCEWMGLKNFANLSKDLHGMCKDKMLSSFYMGEA